MSARTASAALIALIAFYGLRRHRDRAAAGRAQRLLWRQRPAAAAAADHRQGRGAGQAPRLARQLSVDFARANLDWRIIEPLPPTAAGHAYDFTTTDAWVEALARHRVRWQLTGQGVPTPDWARDPSADADPADPESWYGVADPVSGAPYPTAEAYREQIEAIAAGTPVPEIGANPCAAPEG